VLLVSFGMTRWTQRAHMAMNVDVDEEKEKEKEKKMVEGNKVIGTSMQESGSC